MLNEKRSVNKKLIKNKNKNFEKGSIQTMYLKVIWSRSFDKGFFFQMIVQTKYFNIFIDTKL